MDIDIRLRADPQIRERIEYFTTLAVGQANDGSQMVACARFLVGAGLVETKGEMLVKRIVDRVTKIANNRKASWPWPRLATWERL